MKTPLLLLLLAIISCDPRERTFYAADGMEITDCMSGIAQEIVAIPLDTNEQCRITEIKQVKCAGRDIFVRSENEIYRFDRTGAYKNRITTRNDSVIRNYTIDTDKGRVIVSDSLRQLHYYAFDGTELYSKDITTGYPWQTLLNLAYYDHALWAVTENLTDENRYEKWLYKLDTDFQLLTGVKLANADLGRFHLDGCLSPEIMVMNKGLYVYSPSPFRETILADTLYLVASGQLTRFPSLQTGGENPVYTVPLHVNERFLITSYQANVSEKENYLFCYDRRSDKVYDQNGLKDDFYQTGVVGDLQALDIHSREYYFYKSGKDIAASFPKRSENDNPVLFFVKLIS